MILAERQSRIGKTQQGSATRCQNFGLQVLTLRALSQASQTRMQEKLAAVPCLTSIVVQRREVIGQRL